MMRRRTAAVVAMALGLAAASAGPAPAQVSALDLSDAPGVGFAGASSGDFAGYAVAGAGDVDGDGVGDQLIGAPFADPRGRTNAGSVYVVSSPAPRVAYDVIGGVVGVALSAGPARVSMRGAGRFSVTPALPDGLSLDPASGVVSGTPARAGASDHLVALATDFGTHRSPLAIRIAPTPVPAPVAPVAPVAPPEPLPLICAGRGILIDAVQRVGSRVRVSGLVLRRLTGHTLTISGPGRTRTTTIARPDGTFSARLPTPRTRAIARYHATAGRERSRSFRLQRFFRITRRQATNRGTRITAQLTTRRRAGIPVRLLRDIDCATRRETARARTDRHGRVSFTLPPTTPGTINSYRLTTSGRTTYTLPIIHTGR